MTTESDRTTKAVAVAADGPTSTGAVRLALVCVSGVDLGRSFRVTMASQVIGRESCEIVLTASDVSRRHARFGVGDDGFEIEDLGSANGTRVNGEVVHGTVPVRVGDRVQVGRTVLVFSQQDELEARVARMQRLESMATMAGGIAHDFNNALAVIMVNLDIVADELPATAGLARDSLEEMRVAAASATALARRLLRLGRPEPMSFGPVVLEHLVTQTATMARRRAHSSIEVVVDVPSELCVLGSYDELQQVVLNLCLNACDAMPAGGRLALAGRSITIDASAAITRQVASVGDYVELSITDTGCGMDATTLARAFEPFFTTKPRDSGTGLGLAMTHTTIRRHGGAVEVDSIVGRGTTFRIALPRAMA